MTFFCSYDDAFTNEDFSSVTHIDYSKDFNISKIAKTSIVPATAYNSPEVSLSQDVIATIVEKSMKTCTDNLMQFLDIHIQEAAALPFSETECAAATYST